MTNALKKALGLADTATEAEVLKALETQAASLAKAENLAKMSAKHKAFHEKLSGDAADKFAAMSSDDRDSEMAKAAPDVEKAIASGDAFRSEGQVFHKRDFGSENAFSLAKRQAETIAKQAADIAKREETETAAQFVKRAADVGQPAEFGATLRKAYSGDATAQGEVEKLLGALQKQVAEGKLFDTMGSSVAKTGSALAEMNAKRDEIRKVDSKLTVEQAFSKAYTDPANSEIVKRMKQEGTA